MITTKNIVKGSAAILLNKVLANDGLRHLAVQFAEKESYKSSMEDAYPPPLKRAEFIGKRNLIYSIDKALGKGMISPNVRKRILKSLVGRVMMPDSNAKATFFEKYGIQPPGFVTISPTSQCNLFCEGCYANSSTREKAHLDYGVFSRILKEKEKFWGSYFTVISGGEPLMWRSAGKGLFDLLREFQDHYFMMYTNGTLIGKNTAEEIAEIGNLTPAISVEGFEEETDARRGKGTFQKIMDAFENLRRVGVPFGVSLTVTRHNAETLLSDKFVDFMFEQQGAIYGWFFHYMPIGRQFTLDLLITPEQRLEVYKRQLHFMEDKKLFFVDFWNGGPMAHGCLSAGRRGGYFYINWNGDVTPCVFFPYSTHNIYKVFESGGDINTVLLSGLFQDIRQWQKDYGFSEDPSKVNGTIGNWLRPCPIRDHYRVAYDLIQKHKAEPIDPPAEEALEDETYRSLLEEYGRRVGELTQEEWERKYLQS